MSRKYTIDKAGEKPDSHDIEGLAIEETADGFELVVPRQVLAKASLINTEPGKPMITFKFSGYKGWDWTVKVDGISATRMHGTWKNNDKHNVGPTNEEDSWTATGTGTGEPGDEDAKAASANYGSS